MGNQQSQQGGANLPSELLNIVGQYSDNDTLTRMRRTGRDGLAVSKPYAPTATGLDTWNEPWRMYHHGNVVEELWANDNKATRYTYMKLLEKHNESCDGASRSIFQFVKRNLEYDHQEFDEEGNDVLPPAGFPTFRYVAPLYNAKGDPFRYDYVPEPEPDYVLDLALFRAKRDTIMFMFENPYMRDRCDMKSYLQNRVMSTTISEIREAGVAKFLLRELYNIDVALPPMRRLKALEEQQAQERKDRMALGYGSGDEDEDDDEYQ